MQVLVIGSGGREHALCAALAAAPSVARLWCAPGSDAIGRVAEPVALEVDDLDGLVAFGRDRRIDLVVPGPELPLVLGIADRLEAAGIAVFGPSAAAARLEGSKAFTKDFCARHGIPTAAHRRFGRDQVEPALAHLRRQGAPVVVKADGLAAGKGVTVATTVAEAEQAVRAAFAGAHGDAGTTVVIEDCLRGEEVSLFALVDGRDLRAFGSAQDHKRVGEGDTGANTGGMGAYAPAPCLTEALEAEAMATIIRPTVDGMAAEGTPFKGVLYAGLMLTETGPQLLEYNVRFGDPECQALLPRLAGDLGRILMAGARGRLAEVEIDWRDQSVISVVMATRGYPGAPSAHARGSEIRGLDAAGAVPGVTICHAGTRFDGTRVLAAGGRVLTVTAAGPSLAEARARVYAAIDRIDWPEGFCRRDIGWRALAAPSAR